MSVIMFNGKIHKFATNDSRLHWSTMHIDFSETCHTLTLPNEIVSKGITQMIFTPLTDFTTFVHQKGLYYTSDMPSSAVECIYQHLNVSDFRVAVSAPTEPHS